MSKAVTQTDYERGKRDGAEDMRERCRKVAEDEAEIVKRTQTGRDTATRIALAIASLPTHKTGDGDDHQNSTI